MRQLGEIEEEIVAALELEDLERVKPKLAECLELIQREASLRTPPPDAAGAPSAPALDAVTGLQERCAAEAAIERAYRSSPINVAVIVLDSLPTINMRFGRNTGDVLLQAFAQNLRTILPSEEELFAGPGGRS